jgi:hypothetical protein
LAWGPLHETEGGGTFRATGSYDTHQNEIGRSRQEVFARLRKVAAHCRPRAGAGAGDGFAANRRAVDEGIAVIASEVHGRSRLSESREELLKI